MEPDTPSMVHLHDFWVPRGWSVRPEILIVESEEILRAWLAIQLQEAGFCVIDANNGQEALAILKARPSIRLIKTDVAMRGKFDGVQLAWAVRDRWPELPIIICSGRLPTKMELPANVVLIAKPVTAEHLVFVVRSLIRSE